MVYYIHTVTVCISNTIRKAFVTVMIGNYIHRVIEGSSPESTVWSTVVLYNSI